MKEEINLLPPAAQVSRRNGLYYKRLNGLYVSLVVALGIVALGYGISFGMLFWLGPPSQDTAAIDGETNITKQIRQTNVTIGVIEKTLADHPAWMLPVSDVLQAVPGGVIITSIDVKTTGQIIEISGSSTTRASVVLLENRLNELPWVTSVDAPLQNFASGPNVTFRFSITRAL